MAEHKETHNKDCMVISKAYFTALIKESQVKIKDIL
jgi:hypothetical protein